MDPHSLSHRRQEGGTTAALEHYRRLLVKTSKRTECMETLHDHIKQRDFDTIRGITTILSKEGHSRLLLHHFDEEETVLHMIVKLNAEREVTSSVIDGCPALITEDRGGSALYKGQTALHIAVTKGNTKTVDLILEKAKLIGDNQKFALLHHQATGSRFDSTVMLGELPFSVATLAFNTVMCDLLLANGAEMECQNSVGDNVCHSLIRYAHLYPDKLQDVTKMFEYLVTITIGKEETHVTPGPEMGLSSVRDDKNSQHIWIMENDNGLNPLQLAAKLGQHVIFKFIMELKGIYCFVNSEDGLFDVNFYDVTDIEAIPALMTSAVAPAPEVIDTLNADRRQSTKKKPEQIDRKPTLEMIFNSDPVTIFKLIQCSPLNYVVNRKWRYYRWFYLLWGVFHMLFMVGYTFYTIDRSELVPRTANSTEPFQYAKMIGEDAYVTAYTAISLFVALAYLLQEVIRMLRGRMPWSAFHLVNPYHNGPFRMMLLLFSITVFVDFLWRMLDQHYANYLLVAAMIIGWWFLVFFLRGFKQFSFFTVMIQKVLIGDMFRFAIIIGMELVAFTTGMYVAFQGSTSLNEDVKDYGRMIHFLFKAMFGLTSIDDLFETRQPWFTLLIYVCFVLLTYVMMINSLIAMMSNTCSMISKDRDVQWRTQQLSITLFFESIFPAFLLRLVGEPRSAVWYETRTCRYIRKRRYYMEVRSLHDVTRSKSRLRVTSETMIESIFNTLKEAEVPGFVSYSPENKPEDTPAVIPQPENLNKESLVSDNAVENKENEKEKKKKRRKEKREKKEKKNLEEYINYLEKTNAALLAETSGTVVDGTLVGTGLSNSARDSDLHGDMNAESRDDDVIYRRRATIEIHTFPPTTD